jgi:hypothetical protein
LDCSDADNGEGNGSFPENKIPVATRSFHLPKEFIMLKNQKFSFASLTRKTMLASLVFAFALSASACGATPSQSSAYGSSQNSPVSSNVTKDDRPRYPMYFAAPVPGAYHPGR